MEEEKRLMEYAKSLMKECQPAAEIEIKTANTGKQLVKCDLYEIEDVTILEGEEIYITCIGTDLKFYTGMVYEADDIDETIILKRDDVIGMLEFKFSDFIGFYINTLLNNSKPLGLVLGVKQMREPYI